MEQLKETAHQSEKILPRVTERITSILQQQIMPAAQQVVASGAPIVLQLGKFTFKLSLQMAQELLQSPIVQGHIMYGYMLDNKMVPETWNEWFYRVIDGDPPPQFSEYDQMIKLIGNIAIWGFYGAKRHMSSIWAFKLSQIILKQIEASENLAPGAIRSIAKAWISIATGLVHNVSVDTCTNECRPGVYKSRSSI